MEEQEEEGVGLAEAVVVLVEAAEDPEEEVVVLVEEVVVGLVVEVGGQVKEVLGNVEEILIVQETPRIVLNLGTADLRQAMQMGGMVLRQTRMLESAGLTLIVLTGLLIVQNLASVERLRTSEQEGRGNKSTYWIIYIIFRMSHTEF